MVELLMGRMELAPHVGQVALARRFVRDELAHVDQHIAADMQLIVSELVTNAVEHGPHAPVVVVVGCTEHHAEVTVDAAGRFLDVGPAETWEVADHHSIAGRGLGIVRSVADHVDVDEHADRFTVTARRHL